MKNLVLSLGFAGVFLAVASCTDHNVPDMLSQADRDFMMRAADANLFEIKAGEMASGKAVVDSVRAYGKHMVMDHSMAGEELMALAQKKMLTLPMTLSEAKQKKLDSLSMMNAMAFDSLYVMMMVVSHGETVDQFQTITVIGSDPDIKTFAEGKLPTLRHHLEKAIWLQEWLW